MQLNNLSLGALTAGPRGGGAAAPYSTEAQAFFDRLFTPPTLARANLYAALIDGLKTDGVWAKLDFLLVAGATDSTTVVDLKNSAYDASIHNAAADPVFTTDKGYIGVGVNCNIQSGFNPATASSPNWTQNSACLFGWTDRSTASAALFIGTGTDAKNELYPYYDATHTYWVINGAAEVGTNLGLGTAAGFWLSNRSASNLQKLYRNAAEVASSANASAAVSNHAVYAPYGPYNTFCVGGGGALSTTDISNLYSRLSTYLTGIGAI